MATQTLTQKVQRLEKRLEHIENIVAAAPKKHTTRQSSHGLNTLAGMWAKKPRTKRDLAATRKRLWNT